jgi:hypothetical protein
MTTVTRTQDCCVCISIREATRREIGSPRRRCSQPVKSRKGEGGETKITNQNRIECQCCCPCVLVLSFIQESDGGGRGGLSKGGAGTGETMSSRHTTPNTYIITKRLLLSSLPLAVLARPPAHCMHRPPRSFPLPSHRPSLPFAHPLPPHFCTCTQKRQRPRRGRLLPSIIYVDQIKTNPRAKAASLAHAASRRGAGGGRGENDVLLRQVAGGRYTAILDSSSRSAFSSSSSTPSACGKETRDARVRGRLTRLEPHQKPFQQNPPDPGPQHRQTDSRRDHPATHRDGRLRQGLGGHLGQVWQRRLSPGLRRRRHLARLGRQRGGHVRQLPLRLLLHQCVQLG